MQTHQHRAPRLGALPRGKQGQTPKNMVEGGNIEGPGTGTSDSIPLMGSNGEFIIKASSAKIIGPEVLEALNELGDEGEEDKDSPAEARQEYGPAKKMRKGGTVCKMAEGGYLFDEYRNPRPGTAPVAAPAAPVAAPAPVAPPPAAGMSPARQLLAQQTQRAAATRIATQNAAAAQTARLGPLATATTAPGAAAPTNAVPFVMPPEPIAATTAPGATPQPTVSPTRAAPQSAVKFTGDPLYPNAQGPAPVTAEAPPKPITGGPSIPGTAPPRPDAVMRGTGFTVSPPPAPPSMGAQVAEVARGAKGPALGAAAMIPEQLDVAKVAANPNATKIDVGTQQAQGLARYGAAGVGAMTGAAIGAPLGPIGAGVGALAGGVYGYYAGDKFIEGARNLAGVDPRAPVAQIPAAAPPAAAVAAPAAPAAAPYPETAGMHSLAPKASPQAVANAVAEPVNPAGNVTRIGNSYSGAPGISGNITVNGKTPGGGFVANAGDGPPVRLGVNPSLGQALSDARDQAQARGDYDAIRRSYDGNIGGGNDPIQSLINNGRPMTTRKATAIAALQQSNTQAASAKASGDLAAKKVGIEAEGAALDNKAKVRLGVLQEAVFNAKTPAEQVKAEDKLRAFQGKYEKAAPPEEYAYAPGGQEVDAATGATVTRPGVIFNKRTGEVRQPQQAQPVRTAPPAAVAELKSNPRLAAAFDAKYGPGSAARALGTQ